MPPYASAISYSVSRPFPVQVLLGVVGLVIGVGDAFLTTNGKVGAIISRSISAYTDCGFCFCCCDCRVRVVGCRLSKVPKDPDRCDPWDAPLTRGGEGEPVRAAVCAAATAAAAVVVTLDEKGLGRLGACPSAGAGGMFLSCPENDGWRWYRACVCGYCGCGCWAAYDA